MENYKLSVGFEPTDKYEKARKDLAQAISSCNELNDIQKRNLLIEFFGAEKVATVLNFLQQYFR